MPLIDRVLAALVVALIATGVVFAIWPQLDLDVTRFIFDRFGFLGSGEYVRDVRDFLRLAPFWLLGGLAALWALRRFTRWDWPAPSLASLGFLGFSFLVGSGLIVNLGLKDHSHRPRPVHVREFGGAMEFRPWYKFDGGCKKNCSFASGEAASGAWMIAPALLAPPPFRFAALAAALTYAVSASALRVLFGGHFLSDVLFGGLISALVVLAMWRFYSARRP